jgi:hypothetical protein
MGDLQALIKMTALPVSDKCLFFYLGNESLLFELKNGRKRRVSFHKHTYPIHEDLPSSSSYFPKPPPMSSPWALGFQHMNFGKIHSVFNKYFFFLKSDSNKEIRSYTKKHIFLMKRKKDDNYWVLYISGKCWPVYSLESGCFFFLSILHHDSLLANLSL